MPELITKFWGYHRKIRREAALDTKLDEFQGKEEIDHSNQGLSDAMEVKEEEAMNSYVAKTINDRLKKHATKEKTKQRKNSSANIANKESQSTKNG